MFWKLKFLFTIPAYNIALGWPIALGFHPDSFSESLGL